MKTLLLILTLIGSTQPALAQTPSLNVTYNRVQDRSTVSTKTEAVKGSDLRATFYFGYKGQAIKESVTYVGLVLDSYSRDWKYLRGDSLRLYILAGEERFNITGTRHDSSVYTGRYSVSVSERLVFVFTLEQFKTLVASEQLELQLANQQFTFSEKTLKGAREILALIEPAR